MFTYKNYINDSVYFSKSAKKYFLEVVTDLSKDVKLDFEVNHGFYKLENKNLIINNKVVYTFKTKKHFLEVVHEVNFLNDFECFKDYENITIFLNNNRIRIMATYQKQNRILNISGTVASMMACKNYNMKMTDGAIIGTYTDTIYIQKFINKLGFECFR